MAKIAAIKELEEQYPDEWLLVEVLEEDKLSNPTKVRLVAHSKAREEIDEISSDLKGDYSIFFTGEIPKKGYAFCFVFSG